MDSLELMTNESVPQMPTSYPLSADVELSGEFLTRKFNRPQKQPEAVLYEMTGDAGYLHQYYRLRQEMFIHVWGLEHFTGTKDSYDDVSDIMIARRGNHVLGGCRLTFHNAHDSNRLPMEKDDFILAEHLPELPLADATYVEISRMAILPEFQNSVVMLELSRQLLKRGAERKANYAFTLAPVSLARNYRKAASLFGLKWEIRSDIVVPDREEYEGIKMVLSMLDLTPVYRRKSKAAEAASESLATA